MKLKEIFSFIDRNTVKGKKLVKALGQLTKEHMSTDEDDSNDANVWVSRPPSYRSET